MLRVALVLVLKATLQLITTTDGTSVRSAGRRTLAGRWPCRSSRSFRQRESRAGSGTVPRRRAGYPRASEESPCCPVTENCGAVRRRGVRDDAADVRGLLVAVAIEDRVQLVQVAGLRIAGQVALQELRAARAARRSSRRGLAGDADRAHAAEPVADLGQQRAQFVCVFSICLS
jgi:hypothetical protein